ncbi:MarR family winged helix-turn-helix transcriptional regulator [Tepidicaulis sp.]|uniref:MarR family winged helix-turn-helix transcriptional regulator n=1 Tax=Tepidicaulis sp. TaxID=1920809 RepID=UPI003B5B70F5
MSGETPSKETVLAWARLMRAGRHVLSAVERDLKQAGFPPLAWYDVLLELRRAKGGLRPGALEAELLIAQHNISRLLARLEEAGLIERRRHPEDGRGQIIVISDAGRALLKDMWPVYRKAIETHVGVKLKSGKEAGELARLLGVLLE